MGVPGVAERNRGFGRNPEPLPHGPLPLRQAPPGEGRRPGLFFDFTHSYKPLPGQGRVELRLQPQPIHPPPPTLQQSLHLPYKESP